MELVKEITVFLENHPGTLGRVAASLGERGINIRGFALSNALDHGALRMVVDDPVAALHIFEERNLLTIENEVLKIQLNNDSGALSRLADVLVPAGVNIEYAYGSAGTGASEPTTLYVRVSDNDKAMDVLGSLSDAQ